MSTQQSELQSSVNKKSAKRVVFVQKFVPHYRLPLFEKLRDKFAEHGIEFVLIYGRPDGYEGSKIKMEYPEWGQQVKSWIIPLPGKFTRYLYWQWAPFKLRRGDFVIVEHASKLLDNYPIFLMQQIGFVSMCYFGHGKNFQGHREIAPARKIKQAMVRRISIWFAYTEISRKILIEQNVPDEKIVVVNNTLTVLRQLEESEVKRDAKRFVYIGGLYKEKRLGIIFNSIAKLREADPEVTLVIAGTGPMQDEVKAFADSHDWCDYLGPVFGEERDKLLLGCTAIVNPGLVGLIAIDSFHYAIPVITVTLPNHSPEIAYLENEENALILSEEGDADSYAALLRRFLDSDSLSEKIRQGCRDSANRYTLDDTAQRFVDGVLAHR